MDLQFYFYEHMLPSIQCQFQLMNDTYQMFSDKFRKYALSQIFDIIISQTSGCEYTCDHLVDASIQII